MTGKTRISYTRVNNEAGMASILIAMITMIIVSLIVIGYATISQREQGQSLDQQLSTQAFYAAESGVSDAQYVMQQAVDQGKAVPGKTSCTQNTDGTDYSPNYPTGSTTVLNASQSVSYSCLLVNPDPSVLQYDGISDTSTVIPMTSANSKPITSLTFSWSPTSTQSGVPSSQCTNPAGTFSSATDWDCKYGLLQIDLVPTAGALSHAGLAASTLTVFFEPTKNAASGSIDYATSLGSPHVVAGNCNESSYTQCTATITGLSSTGYTMRVISLYDSSNVSVTGYNGATQLSLSGAQAVVDVTGNANGVLRRIQVNIPINNYDGTIPDAAIQSNAAICKRFEVTPGYFSIPNDIVDPDTSNDMCVAQTSGTPGS